ncbi:MAG TPA: copper chaperone PCu(A)C [Aestuariivirga sp.]|nr:copper chaperone PCu(A)C [Aestuariivirga sp.]
MQKTLGYLVASIWLILASNLAMASGVKVTQAFARASPTPQATSAVVYMTLVNEAGEADRLIAISSSAASMVHLHETKSVDGILSMRPVEGSNLGPGESIVMQPGGLHVMLMGLKAPLKKGESITLELIFERAGNIAVEVPVGSIAATDAN